MNPSNLTNAIDALLGEEQRVKIQIDSDKNSVATAFATGRNKSGTTFTRYSKAGHPVESAGKKSELEPKQFRGKDPDDEDGTATGATTGTLTMEPNVAAAFQTHRMPALTN